MDTIFIIMGSLKVVWLTLLFTSTYVRTQKKACIEHLPQPTNLQVSVSKPGQYTLTWDCDFGEEPQKKPDYRVEVKKNPGSAWAARLVTSKHMSDNESLCKGLSFRVKPVIRGKCSGNYSEEIHYIPEGMNGTAAENISCVVYSKSSMRCMWAAGIEAPDDTQYILSLMQNGQVEKCQEYKKDFLGREIACHVHDLKINPMKEMYILIEGHSNKSKIIFFDQWFTPSQTGIDGTEAANVSCLVYNTSSMNCTWAPGANAPKDTQYSLLLKQKENIERCHHYKNDSLGREIACHIDDLKINLLEETSVLIEGQSNKVNILTFHQRFKLSKTEILNPPSNITVDLKEQNLVVRWEKPRTSYYAEDHCFKYEISIMEKIYSPAFNEQSFTLSIHGFKEGGQYTVKMRASGLNCGFNSEWGEWSRPIKFGIPGKSHLLTILGVIIAPVLMSLLLLYVCKRCKLKQKIWPPVPQPKNNLIDFQKELNKAMKVSQKDIFEYYGEDENEDITRVEFEKVPLN
ncbi:granulocyte-macrophage colony-stimulating factor receptor subunit alpha-like [Lissotriton helveticus]